MSDIPFTRRHMAQLIDIVIENPELYNQSLPTYKDQIRTNNCWKKIAKRFNDIEGITGEILRKKWKNKRDSYKKNRRILNTRKSGSAPTKVTKIEFFDQLTFLDPHIAERSTTSNVPEIISFEESDGGVAPDAPNLTPSQSNSDGEMSDDGSLESAIMVTPIKKRKKCGQTTAAMPTQDPPLSPSASVSSGKKKKRSNSKEVDKIDAIITEISKNMNSTDEDIKKIQEGLLAKEVGVDDFYVMMSRRIGKMSNATQDWMEEQVWDLYMQAKRREQGTTPTTAMQYVPCTQSTPSYFGYSQQYLQHMAQAQSNADIAQASMRSTQHVPRSSESTPRSAFDFLQKSMDMCNE